MQKQLPMQLALTAMTVLDVLFKETFQYHQQVTGRHLNNMEIIRSREFKPSRPWAAKDIANMSGITTRLHWTDKPYKWHINEGEEVFVVLSGVVNMHYKLDGKVLVANLQAADIFYATVGTEHVAHPVGEARILVIETAGSV